MPSVEYQVREVTAEALGIPFEDVTLGASLLEDLGADSLDLTQYALELEDHFGLSITDDELVGKHAHAADLKVKDVVDLIERKLTLKKAAP